ncbi:hypothetical protein Tco_0459386 [Tanacetum coccineum]
METTGKEHSLRFGELPFRKQSCYVRDSDGVELLKGEQYAEVNPFAAADPEPFVNVFAPRFQPTDIMADAEHAPSMAPPIRTDEQIMPRIR